MAAVFFPHEHVDSVFSIDFLKLYRNGFRGIIFDIDNTLVHHGDDSNERVDSFFEEIHGIGFRTLLLSNNSESRVQRFNKNIGTQYIYDAGKPDPKGYLNAVEMMGLEKSQVLCIGDQIFTDIFGANRAGIPGILVDFIRLPGVRKIGIRRYAEKAVLFVYRLSRVYTHRLGDIRK